LYDLEVSADDPVKGPSDDIPRSQP